MVCVLVVSVFALMGSFPVYGAMSNLGSVPISNCEEENINENLLVVVFDDECSGSSYSSVEHRGDAFFSRYPCFSYPFFETEGVFAFSDPEDEHHYVFADISDISCIDQGLNDQNLPSLDDLCINEIFFDETVELALFTTDRFCKTRDVSSSALPNNYGSHLDVVSGTKESIYEYIDEAIGTIYETTELVDIYIMDTGIRSTHDEFDKYYNNQVIRLGTCYPNEDINNQHFHGTYVASIAGGYDYGASRGQRIYDVQVCNEFGGCSLACALEELRTTVEDNIRSRGRRAVINMSFGGYSNSISFRLMWFFAVQEIISLGGIVVAAAGNDGIEACITPSIVSNIIAVGAHNQFFQSWQDPVFGTNYGSCIDVYAQGEDVTAAGNSWDSQYITASGTSAASPVVAGVIVNWLLECELLNYHEPCTIGNIRERLTDPYSPITNSGSNTDQCGVTGVECQAIKWKCGDQFYPRTIDSCSDTGNSIYNPYSQQTYCSYSGAGDCQIYHSPPGCDQCISGTFRQSQNHPCIDCQDVFGDQCLGCNNFNGCCQCKNGFGLLYDNDSQMWFCHPTPCLNPLYNCRVCNWHQTATYCSQCDQGFNNLINWEYCT